MYRFSLLLTIICTCVVQAYGAGDSILMHRAISGTINERSGRNADGKFYTYIPMRMAAGDRILIVYTSRDYVTAIAVRDSAGHIRAQEDNGTQFKTAGSTVLMSFRADREGTYKFYLTTRENGVKGNFNADLFYYTRRLDKVTVRSSFCEKLQCIVNNNYLGFAFLKGSRRQGNLIDADEPSILLAPEASCQIVHDRDNAYVCTWPVTTDLTRLRTKYTELATAINNCLPKANKKLYTAEMVTSNERKAFVGRVDFSEAGRVPYDMQRAHGGRIKYTITLRLTRVTGDTYKLMLKVN